MRTALRTSIVIASLAGAMLAPAAGAAFAAPAAHSVAGANATAAPVVKVAIGDNLVAHMSNSAAQGPRVAIHIVEDGVTRPKAMTVLDRSHTAYSAQGTTFTLTRAQSAEPVLTVFVAGAKGGTTTSFPLPKGAATTDKCVSPVKRVDIGEGSVADLTMSPEGPKVFAHSADPAQTWSLTLTRTNPVGRDTRIVNPSGAQPRYEWSNPQGGVHVPLGSATFPALPKGCKPNYTVHNDTATPAPKPSTKPAGTKPQTGGQTSVVPKGPVAAGAELPVGNLASTGNADSADNTATVAAGAGLIAVFGALGASVFLRRRRAQG
ncbi:hypothetical protein [Streptomyces sp. NPDC002104]